MARAQPQPTSAKPAAGVLPIALVNANASAPQANGSSSKDTQAKPVPQKLKVVIRRLPPGLTQDEFETTLGEEWKPGKGKVSWRLYRPGKVSKDLSKPSKPARAYLQVTEQAHLDALAARVRDVTFHDAKKTESDPVLIAPPTLAFAPYGRVPFGRKRNDARQGLIDQDPEFIQFLESLTDPIVKPLPGDGADTTQSTDEAPKVTPLIQHLREKKAAKDAAKDKDRGSTSKASRHGRQGSKNDTAEATASTTSQKGQSGAGAGEKKVARGAKAEKAQTKQNKKDSTGGSTAVPPTPSAQGAKGTQAQPRQRPEVGSGAGAAAARLIQRDLGIKTAQAERGGRRAAAKGRGTPAATNNTVGTTPSTLATASGDAAPGELDAAKPVPTNPAILKQDVPVVPPQPPSQQAQAVPAAKSNTKAAPTPPVARGNKAAVNPIATQAFLKHANPSQGITETLLEEAFAQFGKIAKVEIDKRKGFAYIDFAEPEGLQKAMAASPVKVAQGSVQVLERKERGAAASSGPVRGGPTVIASRGGSAAGGPAFRGGRGGRGRGGAGRGVAQVSAQTGSTDAATATQGTLAADGALPSANSTTVASTQNENLPQGFPSGSRSSAAEIPSPQTLGSTPAVLGQASKVAPASSSALDPA